MKVLLKRAVAFKGINYAPGEREIPSGDVKGDWFFAALVSDGDATVLDEADEAPEVVEQVAEADAKSDGDATVKSAKAKEKGK